MGCEARVKDSLSQYAEATRLEQPVNYNLMKLPIAEFWVLLRRYLIPQGSRVAWMSFFLLLGIGLQVLNPQIARRFVDATQNAADSSNLSLLAVLFIVAALVSSGFRAVAAYISNEVAWQATNALRADLAAHSLNLGMGFHKSRPPGEMIERIDGDVNALSGFFSSFVVNLGGNFLLLIGVLIALTVQDWRLGAAFTVYAIFGVIFLTLTSRFANAWQLEREKAAQFYGFMGEVLNATEDIRGNGATAWTMRRMKIEMRDWFKVRFSAGIKNSIVWGASIVFWVLADALTYGFGSSLYREGVLSLGAVYMLMHYAWMVAQPIENFRQQMQELQRAEASIARVKELFGFIPNIQSGTLELPSAPHGLAVNLGKVSFAYEDNVPVLENISLQLESGSILGLLGRTGSGKTTLARLLFRFYDPQNGIIKIGGNDLRKYELESFRTGIALVTQDVQLFQASLRDNLTFFDSNISDTRLLEALHTLGLSDWYNALPNGLETPLTADSLSSGEAQLVALSRAFLRDPKLIILDEASARLDPATESRLETALDKLLENRTAIIIAHRLKTVERATDILILQQGKILEFGKRQDLSNNPTSSFAELRRVGLETVLV
jgi:ATP-binding cassette, subfamily B, bacterial